MIGELRSVCVSGASGFIGQSLVKRLSTEGYLVSVITRKDFVIGSVNMKLKGCSIVINLAGESIAGRWTRGKKNRIYESRVLTTRKLVEAINNSGDEINTLIQISAVGIYDNLHLHNEESEIFDNGFLSHVIHDWEGELKSLKREGCRVVVLRLGVVLDKGGGILEKMLFPLRLRIGIGISSEEYFPFIHLEDLLNIFLFCITSEKAFGIVNVSAPVLTKINGFFRVLMEVKKAKLAIWLRPGLILLILGESGVLLTKGQRIIPEKLVRMGFIFRYDNIEDALRSACN